MRYVICRPIDVTKAVKYITKDPLQVIGKTGPDGAVVMSLANGLVGTEFTSQYRLQPRQVCP